ncbi:MAG: hypothetical protein OXC44_01090 [Proteobacteria bacterium]|nr:hypothetical protein [Pseudomonadota bacterium]
MSVTTSQQTCLSRKDLLERLCALASQGCLPQMLLLYGNKGIGKYKMIQKIIQHTLPASSTQAVHMNDTIQDQWPDVWQAPLDEDTLKRENADALRQHLRLQPARGPYRIVIIKDVERFSIAAINVLLKTFEEPPAKAIILLTSSRKDALPHTLLSRLISCYVPPLDTLSFCKALNHELAQSKTLSKTSLSNEECCKLASLCGGSVGEALFFIEHKELFFTLKDMFLAHNIHSALHSAHLANELAKRAKITTAPLLQAIEMSLNMLYRQKTKDSNHHPQTSNKLANQTQAQIHTIHHRRQLLTRYHKALKHKPVALNNHMILNALLSPTPSQS